MMFSRWIKMDQQNYPFDQCPSYHTLSVDNNIAKC